MPVSKNRQYTTRQWATIATAEERLAENLSRGIQVDDIDLDLLRDRVWSIHTSPSGGVRVYGGYEGKIQSLARVVHSRMTGRDLASYTRGDHVRHISQDSADCRRANINEVTGAAANHRDLNRRIQSNNTSGITGVFWCKREKKWVVRLRYSGRLIGLGYHNSLETAAAIATRCREVRAQFEQNELSVECMRELLQAVAKDLADNIDNIATEARRIA